jgi:hypothetical protein
VKSSLPPNNKSKSEDLAADKRALQLLLDNLRLEREDGLERKFDDSTTRRKIGKLISQSVVKTERNDEN